MEIIESISESGILIVIAGVFLYTYISDKKENKERDAKYNESLRLLSESNVNIAKALDLLNVNSVNNDKLLREHDERAILINERLLELQTMQKEKNLNEIRKQKYYRYNYCYNYWINNCLFIESKGGNHYGNYSDNMSYVYNCWLPRWIFWI